MSYEDRYDAMCDYDSEQQAEGYAEAEAEYEPKITALEQKIMDLEAKIIRMELDFVEADQKYYNFLDKIEKLWREG